MLRKALVVVTVLGFLSGMGVVAPARAHEPHVQGCVYGDPHSVIGVEAWVEASHGAYDLGYLKSESKRRQSRCGGDLLAIEIGQAQIEPEWWKGVSGGSPYKCKDYGVKKNTTRLPGGVFRWTYSVPAIYCGNGWYGNYSGIFGYAYGSLRGGWVFSGYHLYPASSPKQMVAEFGVEHPPAPEWPAWVDPVTRVVDPSKLPSSLVGEFGAPSTG